MPLLSFTDGADYAVVVVASTGLSPHKLVTISLAAFNRGVCSGISITCAKAGYNKHVTEGIGLNLSLYTSMFVKLSQQHCNDTVPTQTIAYCKDYIDVRPL